MLLTEECNLRCDYCYIYKQAKTMTVDIARDSVDFLFKNAGLQDNRLGVCFFGGEPLLEPKLLELVADYALEKAGKTHTINFSITTNATLLSKSNAELLKKYNVKTTFSIDGINDAHDTHRKTIAGKGSFAMIERNMEHLLGLADCTIRLTVTPETAATLCKSVKWLIEQGFKSISISPVYESEWTEQTLSEYFDALENLYKYQAEIRSLGNSARINSILGLEEKLTEPGERGFGCGAARRMVAIDAKGFIYPCHRFVGYFKNGQSQQIGHVTQGFFKEKREYYIESCHTQFQEGCGSGLFKDNVPNADKNCMSCSFSQGCSSACMAINEHMTGNPRKSHPINRVFAQIHAAVHVEHREKIFVVEDNDLVASNCSTS